MRSTMMMILVAMLATGCEYNTNIETKKEDQTANAASILPADSPPVTKKVASALISGNDGKPVACTQDADCAQWVETDDCIKPACNAGFCNVWYSDICCTLAEGKYVSCGSTCGGEADCDDGNACTHDVCNAHVQDGVCTHALPWWYEDADGDGHGNVAVKAQSCEPPANYVAASDDCDDSKASVYPTHAELCDHLDNNCDGQTDEENAQDCAWFYLDLDGDAYGQSQQPNKCLCAPVNDYRALVGEDCNDEDANVHPGQAEVCNGTDDNCNGAADEDIAALTCGVGECYRTTSACVAGQPQTCVPGQPTPEVCDLKDNDCDSNTDEDQGTTTCGVGECVSTIANCVAGQTQTCVPGTPSLELCDLKDNDCDGTADNNILDLTCGVGVCQRTIVACVLGQTQICVPGLPATEVCNNLDDNCNEQIDENLGTTTCGVGECVKSTANCVNGAVQSCVPGLPATEVCDLKDNDCNGSVDDGISALTCGVGECYRTTLACIDGLIQSCVPGTPSFELCDLKDNDCNGQTDDMGMSSCGIGECYNTTLNCKNGVAQTCTPGQPTAELCDLKDNDCNGQVDEGATCSSCNTPVAVVQCGSTVVAGFGTTSWLDTYSCRPALPETGYEAVFSFNSLYSGLKVTAKPMNVEPAANPADVSQVTDLDVFVLDGTCAADACKAFGFTAAVWAPVAGQTYHVVVDQYKGTWADTFALQVTCKETSCQDGLDNDQDDKPDCADPDCAAFCF